MIGSLRFAGDLPLWAVLLVAVIAAAAVVWIYLRESKSVASPYSYLLPALRATAIVLTILILSGPVLHRRQVIGTLGRVVFAIDTSQSMSISDSTQTGSSPSRLGRAMRLLLGDESQDGWLRTLQATHDVDVIGFSAGEPLLLWSSRDEQPVPTAIDVAADGQQTDLSISLRATLDSMDPNQTDAADIVAGDEQRAALVMFTDGRDNAGQSAADIAKQLRSQAVVVHAVGMGSQSEPPDVGIVNVINPESVASDGQLSGQLVLKQFGMAGQPLQLRIESAGRTIWQSTVTPASDGMQSVPFELDVEPIVEAISENAQRGVLRSTVVMDLRAAVQPLAGDSVDDNNAKAFRVAANTRDRRLLILDGSSRWETRYLRNVFQRDPAWDVTTVIAGPGTGKPTLTRGDEPDDFPDSRESMARYDAIILGEIPSELFTSADWLRLKEFVTRGGGLIVIDGRYGRLRKVVRDSLSDLVPIRYDSTQSRLTVDSLAPTPMGLEHPVLNVSGDAQQLAEFWSVLPAPKSVNAVSAQEGAEVWANVLGPGGVESPWLVTRLFGAGRVFYLSTDQTWRWRYKVADKFHARFWNQLLASVMQPPYSASDEYVALGTNKVEYKSGESSTIRVRLQNTIGKPVGDATVDALLVANDRVIASVPLDVDDPARGTYQGQTPPLLPGAYSVRIRASGFDEAALQASTPIWVSSETTDEMRRVGLDENALNQIVTAASGTYV
ncbi:MAG: hypothetical protein HKN47_20630, partial [Pirellulaceae bacterium]|nr:hypothetical protein [Pirellulaceae bacterium]